MIMNKKRKTFIIVLGILAIILGTWSMIEGLKYIKEKDEDKVVTVGELVEKFHYNNLFPFDIHIRLLLN